jgi:hypothetical protein
MSRLGSIASMMDASKKGARFIRRGDTCLCFRVIGSRLLQLSLWRILDNFFRVTNIGTDASSAPVCCILSHAMLMWFDWLCLLAGELGGRPRITALFWAGITTVAVKARIGGGVLHPTRTCDICSAGVCHVNYGSAVRQAAGVSHPFTFEKKGDFCGVPQEQGNFCQVPQEKGHFWKDPRRKGNSAGFHKNKAIFAGFHKGVGVQISLNTKRKFPSPCIVHGWQSHRNHIPS